MSDNIILEQLPNEIFHELFEYFNNRELYKTFSRLNSRIDSLLMNFKYLQVTLYSPDDMDYPDNRYFLSRTKTLIIDHSKKFLDPLNSTLFLHIRCLILCQPTREQWDSIRPFHFPYLERLYLINSTFVYRTEQLCCLIFSNAFPHLHTCSLPRVSYEINNLWTYSVNLYSLQINTWDIRVYTQILTSCPNLIRFKIELGGGYNPQLISINDAIEKHSVLRQLALFSSGPITCEFIDSILYFVPNLHYVSLNANHQRPSHIPIDTLASIFEHRTPKLSRINIDITLPDDLCKQRMYTNSLLFKSRKIRSELNRPMRLLIVGAL